MALDMTAAGIDNPFIESARWYFEVFIYTSSSF